MFVFKKDTKQLLLPITLKQSDPENKYRSIDFFQGAMSIKVDADAGIEKQYDITHMDITDLEKQRKIECEKYTPKKQEEETCVDLIGGGEYCSSKKSSYNYVPKYCYAESPLGEYLSNKSWNYSNQFVKRAIWIGDSVYTISDTEIKESDLETGEFEDSLELN